MKFFFNEKCCLLLWIICSCASSSYSVRDVNELMPPTAVEVERNGKTMVVSWHPSPHENRDDFVGYGVYVARRSLMMTPVEILPAPIVVAKSQHSTTVDTLDAQVQYFVHVRSRSKNGALSLPSLPEKIVESASPKKP